MRASLRRDLRGAGVLDAEFFAQQRALLLKPVRGESFITSIL